MVYEDSEEGEEAQAIKLWVVKFFFHCPQVSSLDPGFRKTKNS